MISITSSWRRKIYPCKTRGKQAGRKLHVYEVRQCRALLLYFSHQVAGYTGNHFSSLCLSLPAWTMAYKSWKIPCCKQQLSQPHSSHERQTREEAHADSRRKAKETLLIPSPDNVLTGVWAASHRHQGRRAPAANDCPDTPFSECLSLEPY
jgi:hypothetical protein